MTEVKPVAWVIWSTEACDGEYVHVFRAPGKLPNGALLYSQQAIDALRAEVEGLRAVGKRVTDAFRSLGEATPWTKEEGRIRHECESAMLALDDAINAARAKEAQDGR